MRLSLPTITKRLPVTPEIKKLIIKMKLARAYSGDIEEKTGISERTITKVWAEYRKTHTAVKSVPTGLHSGRSPKATA
jgi:hypothetical protein